MVAKIYYQAPTQDYVNPKTTVRVGLVQWQMRTYKTLDDLFEQVEFFVDAVSDYKSDFVLFPEYFNAPLMAKFNNEGESQAIRGLAAYTEEIKERFVKLAISYNINIITGSMPLIKEDGLLYNVGFLCRRDGSYEMYEKIHVTPDEIKSWGLSGGKSIQTFDTDCAKIGVLICYDVEFPELSRIMADQGMQILFVPFLTDTQNAYSRVKVCAHARAIENECFVVIAGSVGNLPRVHNMDIQYAQSGVFTPCDFAFPTDGQKEGDALFVTPYYLSLLNIEHEGYDDATVRSYIMYSNELVDTYGSIKAWEKEDMVVADEPNAAGWLLPEGHNIHRRYPEVAILIPDSMGRACGGLCASCQRMYDFQSERLNFDFEALKPKESWDRKLRRLMRYFEEDAQLRDILITGGDALMSQNATLRKILEAVYKMAVRKRKANESRSEGEKYAELQRVRLGSRLLAYLPLRVTDELVGILREFKEKASAIGVSQFYIQTHFQSPLEVTPEARHAIEAILAAGWTITNQLVYTVSASRRGIRRNYGRP